MGKLILLAGLHIVSIAWMIVLLVATINDNNEIILRSLLWVILLQFLAYINKKND